MLKADINLWKKMIESSCWARTAKLAEKKNDDNIAKKHCSLHCRKKTTV